ncbi:thioredoxin domain-containing protein [Arcicella sp. LKC2W]|uniref:thioredoxin domain-containing protein n=1 Tax=Arcicella sp. LKC2W TaxID=2984198 RepID=UPI002B1E9334|nr:thioredoxin domain-containing protein [Arcicella sp. LKC2W]MEA5457451.1 thioredoxin domain-containing protein [Arcicella sp. LKC2W]
MNRLAKETSPYLLQHAQNPVDWFPWGEEALAKAKAENKPILVSIGYSACHWCHVMEHESFEKDDVAEVMNKHFVSIKIDREERPDIDAIYMDAVQAMGVQGGWPLNVFLMPDGKPFYGGTYFPKQNWIKLLEAVNNGFANNQEELQKSAEGFTENMLFRETDRYGLIFENQDFVQADLDMMYKKLTNTFDEEWGGFQRSPKFPMPSIWMFLLRYAKTSPEGLAHLKFTLNKIAIGGIYDQLGGGFARYSVDSEWFCPHFEKMLYDNGQLVSLYSEAYTLTQEELYKETVYETIGWLKREMASPEGGFYSALDADSEGVEGKYYVWYKAEIDEILGTDSEAFCKDYQVTEYGNWEHGVNILWKNDTVLNSKYKEQIEKLNQERNKRIRPGLDDKILCSWNGLMLKGLVDGYRAFGEAEFLELALQNAHFIKDKFLKDNILSHSYKNGEIKIKGFLEDYAAVIDAYTSLYQATFEEIWLHLAEKLTLYVCQNFWDEEDQLFYFTDKDAEALIARKKEIFDNVIPCSNSMMARNLYTLGLLLDREDFKGLSKLMLCKMKDLLLKNVDYLTNWACLATQMVLPTVEFAIVGNNADKFRKEIDLRFHPNKVISGTKTQSELPLLENRTAKADETLVFVCYNKTCQLPVKSVEEAFLQIR